MYSSISNIITTSKGKIHYLKSGSGKRLIFAFHGFGDDCNYFKSYNYLIGQEFTIISIDLPHHGLSIWKQNDCLTSNDLLMVIKEITNQENAEQLYLLGYSIGCRVCLSLISVYPNLFSKCYLLAPDGLSFNPFYFFVTRTFLGKQLFKLNLNHPQFLIQMLQWANKLNLIPSSKYRFILPYLKSSRQRKTLLKSWPNLRLLQPNYKKLSKCLQDKKTEVIIFIGKFDSVIPLRKVIRYQQKNPEVKVEQLNKGHKLNDETVVTQVARKILNACW